MITSTFNIQLKSIVRKLWLTKNFKKSLNWNTFDYNQYEKKFKETLTNTIRQGDYVYDIGAASGYYSEKLQVVGPTGMVRLFVNSIKHNEPFPADINDVIPTMEYAQMLSGIVYLE